MILRCFSFLLGAERTGVALAGTGNESGINISSCNKDGDIGRISSSSDSSANGSIVPSSAVEAVATHEFLFSSSKKKKGFCVQYTNFNFTDIQC